MKKTPPIEAFTLSNTHIYQNQGFNGIYEKRKNGAKTLTDIQVND
jgi:hypothetical protein